jgi:mobilization protein NikA
MTHSGRVPPSEISVRRCSVKPQLRTKFVGTKVSDAEYAALEARARASGLTLSEWVRDVLLASSPEAESQVVPAELLGLRTILMNLLFSIARGEAQ